MSQTEINAAALQAACTLLAASGEVTLRVKALVVGELADKFAEYIRTGRMPNGDRR